MDVSEDSIFIQRIRYVNARTRAQILRHLSWAHAKTTLASHSVTNDHVERLLLL